MIHLHLTLLPGSLLRIRKAFWRGVACVVLLVASSLTARAQDIHQLARAVDEPYNRSGACRPTLRRSTGRRAERTNQAHSGSKSAQDALGISFSQGEALCERREGVWFYLPEERQVRKTDFRKLDDLRSPIAFLLGKTKLENELQGLSKVVDQTAR